MIRQDFNAGWSVARDVSGMMGALYGENNAAISVTLPDDAMIREEKSPNSATGNSGAFYPGGNYIYTKNFFVPEDENQHLHILEFEASYHYIMNKGIQEGCKNAECVVAAFGLKMERPQELKPAVFPFFVLCFTLCAILESKCYSPIGVVRSLHQNTSSTAHTAQIMPPITLAIV